MCDSCGCGGAERLVVEVNRSVLDENRRVAQGNRRMLREMGAVALNLMSSPGAGKTTLLERTIAALKDRYRIGVIEGDVETERDAQRIRAQGVPVVQLTTGGACHLSAALVHKGLHGLKGIGEGVYDLVFIENVGNLVCPAAFDLGEDVKVALLSVPEGSDKPAKYPALFREASLFIITKVDLLEHFDFSLDEAERLARGINPDVEILRLSAVSGEGVGSWLEYVAGLAEGRRGIRP